ncbi:sulfotransferase family cytosolic 2B member 1-like [Parambassis ranga]|uniref:Sulfotransferase n=1 Tax=Parambassis ranga TaxID=210632 RepID=A0A6P7IFS7_9TELE|nr:sulfotransferase family cytosolic 2B member 1-like [Parambassis ranga]
MDEEQLYIKHRGVYLSKLLISPESLQYFDNFTFRPDDIIIATYPKSGTHWMQHMVSLIFSEGDMTSVDTLYNWERAPWLENVTAVALNLEERPSPRVFTTHFPYTLMPQSFFEAKPKVIYVMRNPKDVFTSYFHFHTIASFLVKPGSSSEFLHKFLDGKVVNGSWFDHVNSWLKADDKEHILYICYEDMITDLKASVAKAAEFLEKHLDDEVMEKIAEKCLFNNMKQNKMSKHPDTPTEVLDQTKTKFYRKGVVGDWKNQLTAEEAERFDAVYADKMKDVDHNFQWD